MQPPLECKQQRPVLPGPWEQGASRLPMRGHRPPALASCRSCQELLVTASEQKSRFTFHPRTGVPSKQHADQHGAAPAWRRAETQTQLWTYPCDVPTLKSWPKALDLLPPQIDPAIQFRCNVFLCSLSGRVLFSSCCALHQKQLQ